MKSVLIYSAEVVQRTAPLEEKVWSGQDASALAPLSSHVLHTSPFFTYIISIWTEIILALFSMLMLDYYAGYYAGIIDAGLLTLRCSEIKNETPLALTALDN